MALKGVLAFILRHFAESGSFWANYIKLTETTHGVWVAFISKQVRFYSARLHSAA